MTEEYRPALGGLEVPLPAESMPAMIQTTCVRGRTAAAAVLILASIEWQGRKAEDTAFAAISRALF